MATFVLIVLEDQQFGGHVSLRGRTVRTWVQKHTLRFGYILLSFNACLLAAQSNAVQPTGPGTRQISLNDVVESALRDYPQIHISQEELNASIANICPARTAYLPRADALF